MFLLHVKYKTTLEFDQLPQQYNQLGRTCFYQYNFYFQKDNAIEHMALHQSQTIHRSNRFP